MKGWIVHNANQREYQRIHSYSIQGVAWTKSLGVRIGPLDPSVNIEKGRSEIWESETFAENLVICAHDDCRNILVSGIEASFLGSLSNTSSCIFLYFSNKYKPCPKSWIDSTHFHPQIELPEGNLIFLSTPFNQFTDT